MWSCRYYLWFTRFANLICYGSAGSNMHLENINQCVKYKVKFAVWWPEESRQPQNHYVFDEDRIHITIVSQAFRNGIWMEFSVPSAFFRPAMWCACVLGTGASRNCEVQVWRRILLCSGLQLWTFSLTCSWPLISLSGPDEDANAKVYAQRYLETSIVHSYVHGEHFNLKP